MSVVCAGIDCLTQAVDTNIIHKHIIVDICFIIIPLLIHPNMFIVEKSVRFVSLVQKRLEWLRFRALIYPQLRKVLKLDIPEVNDSDLRYALTCPIDANLYEEALGNFYNPESSYISFQNCSIFIH